MIHLHGWSHYSMLSAIGTPKDIITKAIENKQGAIAITDLNSGCGLLEFYEQAKDIKPILGAELNFSYDGTNIMNIVLLAKTYTGYENLIKLISIANTENYKIIPYINLDNLKAYSNDIIALSSGNGEIEKMILSKEKDSLILDKISEYEEIFNGDFYLEFLTYEYDKFPDRKVIEDKFIKYMRENNKKAVVSSNYKYINKEDSATYEVLLCIKNNWKFYDPSRPKIKGNNYIMSEEEVEDVLSKNNIDKDIQNIIISTTDKISDSIDCNIPLHQLLFPKYVVPDNYQSLYKKLD